MNCLANMIFENLLFVDVMVGSEKGFALFDSGAQKTVVSESFLRRCNGDFLTETVKAGNNNGNAITLNKGVLKSIKIADKALSILVVLVIEDDMFIMEDSKGHRFEADMLLGYDVINMYKWIYNPTMHTLDIGDSDMTIKKNLVSYAGFAIINVYSNGQSYNTGIDTGHTETILGKNVKCENFKPVYI